MHKDPNLRKRNALVIPGGLFALYGILGMLYAAGVRSPSDTCPDDGSLIWIAGACRSAILVLAIPVVLGLAMVGVGFLAFRSRATCRNGHGSWTHFGLAFLLSAILLPVVAYALVPSVLGSDAVITRGGVDYAVTTILGGLFGVAVLMFIPFAVLYAAQVRANPCCREKGCFTPCFCDEQAVPDQAPPEEPAPEAPATIPEGSAVPPAAAAAPQWETVPEDAPAEQAPEAWDVVPDETPTKSVTQGEWRVVETPATADSPAVLTAPKDPATPPADAMAVAAKWAEEDEEARKELAGKSAQSRKDRAPAKPAPKPAKPVAKPAKKGKTSKR
ncbi:MAG: hypothetical protein WC876_02610 [Candidatus Thermoplasmatota archaeon]|jgi:hypothetical protein